MNDIRYSIRVLLKNPAFTLTALLTLALGIGVNTAIFSVVDSVLLRPLPLKDSERVVSVWEHNLRAGVDRSEMAPANYFDLRTQNQVFEGVGAFGELSMNLTGAGEPERLEARLVTANVFALLGIQPSLGRTFAPEEDQVGRDRVVVLSDGLWRRRFNSDPSIVGRNIALNAESYLVVGVMP